MDDLSSLETGSGRTRPSTPMFAGLHIDRSDIPRGPETPQPDALSVQLAYTVEIFETRKVEPRFPLTPAMERCADQACLLRLLLNAFTVT